jgi:hypothetical protein
METGGGRGDKAWKLFVRRHAGVTLLMIGGFTAAALAALFVFLWVVASAQANGLVPSVLGLWTVGHGLTFILNVILWEILLVASWVIPVALAVFFLWYKELPEAERSEYEGTSRRRKAARGSGGLSFFAWLVWLVIVWTDGRWNLAFQNWTFNQLIYSWIAAGLVVSLIVGIPGAIYVVWSLRKNGSHPGQAV